jgi:hypothetical protein
MAWHPLVLAHAHHTHTHHTTRRLLAIVFMLLGPYSLLWIQRSHDQVLVPQPTGRLHDRQIQRNQGTTRTERRRPGGQQREAYAALCHRRRRRKSQRKSMNHRCRPPEGPSPAWAKWYVRSARRFPTDAAGSRRLVISSATTARRPGKGKSASGTIIFLCFEPVPHHLLATRLILCDVQKPAGSSTSGPMHVVPPPLVRGAYPNLFTATAFFFSTSP